MFDYTIGISVGSYGPADWLPLLVGLKRMNQPPTFTVHISGAVQLPVASSTCSTKTLVLGQHTTALSMKMSFRRTQ